MASIQTFLAQSKQKTAKNTVSPATYDSFVEDVAIDDRYKDQVLVVTYKLKNGDNVYEFQERFVKNPRFQRTREFFDYLFSNGIDDEKEFVGCHEVLELKWNFTKSGKRELTIVNREFVGVTADDEVSNTKGGGA